MDNGKMFDYPPKCPGMLTSKLTSIFGWRHTYRVHHRQKGINHFYNNNSNNLHKTYSLNLPPKKNHETTSSNPSLPEASTSSSKTNPNSWVVVHHLQSQSGILDPDDHVHDVADDREQILASYDDHLGPDPGVQQGGGDGASGSSSVGTGSPDIFRLQDGKYTNHHHNQNEPVPTHIDVTESDHPPNGLTLQVRRGSEPSLLALDQNTKLYPSENSQEPSKRWSAAPVCRDDPAERLLTGSITNGTYLSPKWTVPEEDNSNEMMPSAFTRSGRLSMQFLGDGANYRWIEAAEKAAHNHRNNSNHSENNSFSSKSLPRDAKQRKEPLGQANISTYESIRQKNGEMLLVTNETGGPLGLTAIPDQENGGLLVQSVEPDSRAEKGRLRRGDRILEINGINLMELSEASVQDQLRKCISSSELRLRVIRAKSETRDRSKIEMFEAEEKSTVTNSKVAHVSPTRKPGSIATSSLQAANTRKLGRRIEITLKKGTHGLGFSVTTRDNPAGGHCPIYIKNILPKGAAIEDGRLKPGDRLLEVDNVTMTGKSQSEVVNILRATQPGATVKIVVSRQQEIPEVDEREIGAETEQQRSTTLPKQPPPPVLPKNVIKSPSAPNICDVIEKKSDSKDDLNDTVKMKIKKFNTSTPEASFQEHQNPSIFPWRNREILTFHIPVHDTEKAGLGVSVKGKTGSGAPNSSNAKHDGDLGIFIKSVLHGGAASRDGRLKMNDQLLSVNGISLLGQSNADAMDTLRRAMLQTGGKYPGVIVLKIARRGSSRPSSTIENGEQHVVDSSGNGSEQSGSTVIYLSPNEKNTNNQQKSSSPITPPQENGKRWSNPVLDRLTGGTGSSRVPSTLIQMPPTLRNDSYYMATNENWSPNINLNGSNGVLIEEDPEPPTSPILPIRPDLQHQISASTPTSAGDITYASQLSLENPVDAFSRDAIGRRSMSEKHHAALDAKETGTYQRNKKIREERERNRSVSKSTSSQLHSSIESLTNMNRIGSMKTRQKTDLKSEAMDKVGDLGPSLGMKKSSSLESLQTMVQEIQMSDEPRGPSALRAPRGRGREEVLRAAVERPESQPRKHWLLEDGSNDNDGGFSNRGTLQSSTNEGKTKDQKKPGFLKGIGHMFRFGKHRKDVYPAQTEVITDYSSWSNDTSQKSATLGPTTVSSPSVHSNTSQLQSSSSTQQSSQNQSIQSQREASHERQLSSNSNGPPSYHAPPPSSVMNGHSNSKITQNDLFNHRYSHYVNYDELQLQISEPPPSRTSRNKLIVTKHQTSHQNQTKMSNAYLGDELSSSSGQQSTDGENVNDFLTDSTIEKMRLQVRMQREKVEESRRNQHYHSQRSARNIDLGHYHHYNGVSPIVNGNKYPHQTQQQQQQQQQHQQPQSVHHMRPISSYYEYETINPNGHYRKLGEHPFIPLQNSNSSSKIINGTSSVRVTGSSVRGPIPEQMKQHRGPFITQVHIRDQNGKHHPSASKV